MAIHLNINARLTWMMIPNTVTWEMLVEIASNIHSKKMVGFFVGGANGREPWTEVGILYLKSHHNGKLWSYTPGFDQHILVLVPLQKTGISSFCPWEPQKSGVNSSVEGNGRCIPINLPGFLQYIQTNAGFVSPQISSTSQPYPGAEKSNPKLWKKHWI